MNVVTGNHYLAFVLSEECRNKLLSLYFTQHPVHVCHHVTLAFKFGEDDIPHLQELVDSNPKFEVNCLVTSDTIDFFRVLVILFFSRLYFQ